MLSPRAQLARMVYGSSRLQQIRQMSQARSFPVLLRSIQWLIKGLLQPEAELVTRHGRFRVSTLDTAVARDLYISGEFEEAVVARAFGVLEQRGLLREGKVDVLLDVGANIGVTCISLLHMGLIRRAVAMEPDTQNHRLLAANIKSNDLAGNIIDIRTAVSDFEGTVELELSVTNHGDHRIRSSGTCTTRDVFAESARSVTRVPVRTLDGIMSALPPDYRSSSTLLWMDVQGHESHVIDGAPALLSGGIPAVMELWPYGMERAGITLRELHQRLARYWSGVVNLNGDARVLSLQEWQTIATTLTRPGDYTNLLLLP